MKKWIRIIVTIGITVILFFVLQELMMPKYMNTSKEGALIGEYYDSMMNHDVIFVGDCEVYENFSPVTLWNYYGINSYIRGSASQTIWQSYYILKDTFEREQPKVVVFNVLSMQYEQPVSEAYNRMNIDGMKLSKNKIDAAKASMTEEEDLITYLFPLLRFHSRWKELSEEDWTYLFRRDRISYNGYLMQTGIQAATVIPEEKPLSDYGFSEKCYDYLDKIRELCEKNNAELVLIKAPSLYPCWYEQWDEQIADYAEEHEIGYYNLLEEIEQIGIDYETDTYDGGMHLNVSGAEKLSVYFGQILRETYGVENRRGEQELDDYFAELTKQYEQEKEES